METNLLGDIHCTIQLSGSQIRRRRELEHGNSRCDSAGRRYSIENGQDITHRSYWKGS